jgi:CRP/FNR family cyclic AMP-dependent transcriptional regulator
MMSTSELETAIEIPLFRGAPADELYRLCGSLRRKTFPSNTVMMAVEQTGEVVYAILSGTVKVYLEQMDGTDVILSILGPGDIVGEMSLLDNADRSASAITLEETSVLWMGRASFHECLRQMPAVMRNLALILSNRLRMANAQIQALAARDVESRIARQILAFGERFGKVAANGDLIIPIRLTQSDFASLTGASREATNRIMVSYKRRRIISVDQKYHITIHNRAALANRCPGQDWRVYNHAVTGSTAEPL